MSDTAGLSATERPADIAFPGGGEEWIEYTLGGERRRVGFHDYAAIYAVPGLYEAVFHDKLGMCSTRVVVETWGRVLERLGRDPGGERVIDVGAGNGLGADHLRALGAGRVVGMDLEPAAAIAAERDRPGAYDAYHVGDLTDAGAPLHEALRAEAPTSVLALSAIGVGHVPVAGLDAALGLLGPDGLFAFAVTPQLTPEGADGDGAATGYPDYIAGLFGERAECLERHEYVHRVQADGSPHHAVAFVGRVSAARA